MAIFATERFSMRISFGMAATALLLGFAISAHADVLQFDATGVIAGGSTGGTASAGAGAGKVLLGTFSGTIDIDTSNYEVVSENLTFLTGDHLTLLFNAPGFVVGAGSFDNTLPGESDLTANGLQLTFRFQVLDFTAPYTGGAVCNVSGNCGSTYDQAIAANGGAAVGPYSIVSGTLTPAVTPEPSSLVLLGTGLVSVIGVGRRRFFKG
jgi:hypothetical protein